MDCVYDSLLMILQVSFNPNCPGIFEHILGLGGVGVPILFENDLLWNDLPYSKGFTKFGCLQPSKVMFDF